MMSSIDYILLLPESLTALIVKILCGPTAPLRAADSNFTGLRLFSINVEPARSSVAEEEADEATKLLSLSESLLLSFLSLIG